MGLFSYGSGSCAEFFSGTVQHGAHALLWPERIIERLNARDEIDVPTYESMMRERDTMDERPAATAQASRECAFLGVTEHRRLYSAAS